MPGWVRTLQPLLSGVFTVDNLDYVRRDAYLTGVSMGPVDAERLRRYCFVSERGLTLYESGVGALEMFLTARLFMYQHVYLHRTVRAIDLDLEEVFAPVDPGGVRGRVAGRATRGVRGPRRVRAAPPGCRLGARRAPVRHAGPGRRDGDPGRRRRLAGDPAATPPVADRARGPRRAGGPRLAGGAGRRAGRAGTGARGGGPRGRGRAAGSGQGRHAGDRAAGRRTGAARWRSRSRGCPRGRSSGGATGAAAERAAPGACGRRWGSATGSARPSAPSGR